jgi:hypothetical protein
MKGDEYRKWNVEAQLLPGSGDVRQVEFRATNEMFGVLSPVVLHVDHRPGMEDEDLRLWAMQLAWISLTALADELASQMRGNSSG